MAPGTVNIRSDIADPFYRYKMERLQSKVEGKGNGIKTVITNLPSVAHSLARPANYLIKYFGFELGAQTTLDPKDDRWIINGAHEAGKLQESLNGFISKYVLCKKCKNPETDVQIKDQRITLDCKACGQVSEVDMRQKLSGFILKNEAGSKGKGKKNKATKKAERKARKLGGENGHGDGSPHDSNSDHADENGDSGNASDEDDLTRRINAEAGNINDEPKEIEWSVDTSEAAVKARAKELPADLKRALVINGEDDEDDGGSSSFDELGTWLIEQAKAKGDINQITNAAILAKAAELDLETKHKTLTVLAQTLFTEDILKEIVPRAPLLKKLIQGSDRHEKALLGGTERFVGKDKPSLIPAVSGILLKYYQNDICSEEVLKAWGSKASKKYVDLSTSRKVRKNAETFITWLETAESEDDEDDVSEDDE